MIPVLPVPTLSRGAHEPGSGKMCFNEAAAFLAGEPHSDRPQCMCPAIASFTMNWHDALPSDEERVRLLGPLLQHVIDTRGSDALAERRSWMAADWLVRTHTPAWMRLTDELRSHADALAALLDLDSNDAMLAARPVIDAAWDATRDAARGAAWDAWDAAWDATRAAAGAAARAAAGATWDAAWDATRDAAWAAAGATAGTAAGTAAGAALHPTVVELQDSALDLIVRMCELRDQPGGGIGVPRLADRAAPKSVPA